MEDINVQELAALKNSGDEPILLDVREPYEHEAFNIGGTLIPLAQLNGRMGELEDKKDEEIVVYCKSGNRSGVAKELMKSAGFQKVRNLIGGVDAWKSQTQ